eukprot:m.213058 g.213058  ORF g.213058 m.213058 type:complete len:412 (-) comp18597_c0_seq3:233-1468(-)
MVLPPPPMLSLTSEATLAACKVINVTEQAGRRGGLVLVCSYPKSGTTVMQNVVLRLCILAQQRHNQVTGGGGEHRDSIHTEDRGKVHTENRGGVDNGVDDGALSKHGYPLSLCDVRHISDWTPFFEIDPHWVPCSDTRASCRAGGIIIAKGTAAAGTATADDAPQLQPASHIAAAHRLLGRRVYNTHLPWNMLPGTAASPPSSPAPPPPPPSLFPSPSPNWPRYIYMVRNGKDVLASFWYHLSNQEGGFDGDLDDFVAGFVKGTIPFGRWDHHVEQWLGPAGPVALGDPRVLVVSYELLCSDMKQQVLRVRDHLGLASIISEQDIEEHVLPKVTFDAMKRNKHTYQPNSVQWKTDAKSGQPYDNFIRRGQPGDGQGLLQTETRKQLWDSLVEDVRQRHGGTVPLFLPGLED